MFVSTYNLPNFGGSAKIRVPYESTEPREIKYIVFRFITLIFTESLLIRKRVKNQGQEKK